MTISFPVATYGTQSEVERQIAAVSKAWAEDLRNGAPLRPLDSREVPPGAAIYCSEITDMSPGRPAFRAYWLRSTRADVCEALNWNDRERISERLEESFLQFAAGVLWLNVGWPAPNTVMIVRERIAALLRYWGELSTILYIDVPLQPQTLEAVIESHYTPFLRLWLNDTAAAPLVTRLQVAVDAALVASDDETRRRMAMALSRMAKTPSKRPYVRLTVPEHFADLAWIEQRLATLDPAEYETAKTGVSLQGLLFSLDRRSDGQPNT